MSGRAVDQRSQAFADLVLVLDDRYFDQISIGQRNLFLSECTLCAPTTTALFSVVSGERPLNLLATSALFAICFMVACSPKKKTRSSRSLLTYLVVQVPT